MYTRNKSTKDMGVLCIKANVYDSSKTKIEYTDVPGALSPVTVNTDVVPRLTIKMECGIVGYDVPSKLEELKDWLMSDYVDLPIRFSTHFNYYWEGYVEDITDIEEYNRTSAKFNIIINCVGYKVYETGAIGKKLVLTNTDYVVGTHHRVSIATPVVKFVKTDGLKSFKLHYSYFDNNKRANIENVFDFSNLDSLPTGKELILDWVNQDFYYISNGVPVPCNTLINNMFYNIPSNTFKVRVEGVDSLAVEVTPYWRVK